MEDDVADEDVEVPPWPRPESPPPPLQEDPGFLPFGGIFGPLNTPLQPNAHTKGHPPYKEDHRGNEHRVEDKVLIHGETREEIGVFGKVAPRRSELSFQFSGDSQL